LLGFAALPFQNCSDLFFNDKLAKPQSFRGISHQNLHSAAAQAGMVPAWCLGPTQLPALDCPPRLHRCGLGPELARMLRAISVAANSSPLRFGFSPSNATQVFARVSVRSSHLCEAHALHRSSAASDERPSLASKQHEVSNLFAQVICPCLILQRYGTRTAGQIGGAGTCTEDPFDEASNPA